MIKIIKCYNNLPLVPIIVSFNKIYSMHHNSFRYPYISITDLVPIDIMDTYNESLKGYSNKDYGYIDPFKDYDIEVTNKILKDDNTECSKLTKFKFKVPWHENIVTEHTIIVQVICKNGEHPMIYYKFITKVIHNEKRSISFSSVFSVTFREIIYKNKELIYE